MLKIILIYHEIFNIDSHYLSNLFKRNKDIIVITEYLIIIYDRYLMIIKDQSILINPLLY